MKKIKEFFGKVIQKIKKKWLISGTKTLLLIVIFVAAFIGINYGVDKLDLTPIDLTEEKLYTLTEQSKEKVKDISEDVNIYFVGYSDDDATLDLAKQYHSANNKINIEAVDVTQRVDLAQKYDLESGDEGIIIECGDKNKILSSSDLYTYDNTTYDTIDITEEALTTAIQNVTTEDIPVVYFLEGYSSFSLTQNMNYLSMYLKNEIMDIQTLDLLVTSSVPDDCKTLVIPTPGKDFDDVTTNAIIDYVNKGGNILWFNGAYGVSTELPNVQKILDLYGVDGFGVGIIMETNSSNMILNSSEMIIPEVQYSDITKDIYSSGNVMLVDATKINVKDDEILENLNVERTDLVTTSEDTFFRSDVTLTSTTATGSDETGSFTVGTQLTKKINDEDSSTLIIFGENYFISDYTISSSSSTPCALVYNNKDLAINSLDYLTERKSDISIRKAVGSTTYTATDAQDKIVRGVIFAVPIIIILVGIVIWQVRRRRDGRPKEKLSKEEKEELKKAKREEKEKSNNEKAEKQQETKNENVSKKEDIKQENVQEDDTKK